MIIRRFEKKDAVQTINLFKDTVTTVNLEDYSVKQVEVWSNSIPSIELWEKRLEQSITYVAVLDKIIVGFCNLKADEVDLLYTHKDYQRQGIASNLLAKIEAHAKSMGITALFTEASITARAFFESHGYELMEKQKKVLDGTDFTNFLMKKELMTGSE